MATITPEVYQNAISETEENTIKQIDAGFVPTICSVAKLMYAHILIHALENIDIFTEDEKEVIDNLVNETI